MQDVVAGKRRTRRHGGAGGLLGSDESEDEEDEEARALRQRLAKKRRVAGDTLDALARNPATVSFHATYQMALVDNAEEFAHLDREQDVDVDVVPDRDREPSEDEGEGESEEGQGEVGGWDRGEGDGRERGVEEDEDEDEDVEMAGPSHSESGKREISAAEVRKALQEVARGERVRTNSRQFLLLESSNATHGVLRNIAPSIQRMYPGWTKTRSRQTKQRHDAYAYA